MLRFTLSFACMAVVALVPQTAIAQYPAYCDPSARSGKASDGRFIGLPYLMMSHALAEKQCGASPKPLRNWIFGILVSEGCGPATPIYRELEQSASRIESANLRELVTEGIDMDRLSDKQVRDAAQSMTDQLGGCAKLIEWHRKLEPRSISK